jgi:predicted porin
MKKTLVALAALIVAGAAQAESSVTLYGLVDAGVTYVNNQGKNNNSNILVHSGAQNGNRWGLRGREELNSDLAAIFRVESGFNIDTGTSGQGGKLFGRQAFAGLDAKNIGTVTFGRQYDFMADIGDYSVAANQFGGNAMLESTGVFHNDSGLGSGATGRRIDNSVKFQSASFGGVSAGAMIGLGEKAADKKAGRALSANIGFNGKDVGIDGLSAKVAYTKINGVTDPSATIKGYALPVSPTVSNSNPTTAPGTLSSDKIENLGVGAGYDIAQIGGKVNGVFTMTKDKLAGVTYKANVYEVGYTQKITPTLSAGLGYQYFDNRSVGFKKNDIHGASFALDQKLSNRTDAYFVTVFNKGKNGVIPDITGSRDTTSATTINDTTGTKTNQVAVRVGLRHRF